MIAEGGDPNYHRYEPYRELDADAFLYVYNCKQTVGGRLLYQDVPRVATFKLPELFDDAIYEDIHSVADDVSAPYTLDMGHSFILDRSLRLITLQLEIAPRNRNIRGVGNRGRDVGLAIDGTSYDVRLLLFVHAGAIERRCQGDVRNLSVEWADWACDTRLMRDPGYRTGWFSGPVNYMRSLVPERELGNVSGVVDFAMHPDERYGGETTYWLYEFASPEVLRSAEAAADGNGPWLYIMEPDSLPKLPIFRNPITATTGLPYRKLNTGVRVGSDVHLHLSGEWVIELTEEMGSVSLNLTLRSLL